MLCFTGFKDRAELSQLCSQAHFMGASIRGDINSSITHIIAHSVSGSKYKVHLSLNCNIMKMINDQLQLRKSRIVRASSQNTAVGSAVVKRFKRILIINASYMYR